MIPFVRHSPPVRGNLQNASFISYEYEYHATSEEEGEAGAKGVARGQVHFTL